MNKISLVGPAGYPGAQHDDLCPRRPTRHGSSFHLPHSLARASDVVSQPGDVSFLLDTLLGWDGQRDSPFDGAVDRGRIGAVGYSRGGLASALLL